MVSKYVLVTNNLKKKKKSIEISMTREYIRKLMVAIMKLAIFSYYSK